jgi:hypothetical protein
MLLPTACTCWAAWAGMHFHWPDLPGSSFLQDAGNIPWNVLSFYVHADALGSQTQYPVLLRYPSC